MCWRPLQCRNIYVCNVAQFVRIDRKRGASINAKGEEVQQGDKQNREWCRGDAYRRGRALKSDWYVRVSLCIYNIYNYIYNFRVGRGGTFTFNAPPYLIFCFFPREPAAYGNYTVSSTRVRRMNVENYLKVIVPSQQRHQFIHYLFIGKMFFFLIIIIL